MIMNRRWLSALLATTFLCTALPVFAQSLPQGGTVVGGDAAISSPDPATLAIDQGSERAIINWSSFNIGDGYAVVFRQPNAGSLTLNRVTGGDPSTILGSLTANGTVMLVNPDGILFGQGAQVDVGALVASTHDMLDANFMAGQYVFDQSGDPSASIVNLGTITAREGGYAALVAPGVRNEGVITARLGKVGLSSANRFALDLYGDDLIKLAVDDEILSEVIDLTTGQPLTTHVDNQGTLSADGGTVAMTGVTARRVVDQVINNDGVIEANSVGVKNGKIVLSAQTAETKVPQAPDQKVRVSGEIIAAGDDPGEYGGKVLITGELLRLAHANIDASGASGGGTVLGGGDYLGGNAPDELVALLGIEREASAMPTASTLYVDAETSIDVSALTDGSGGKAVFWSDNSTLFAGTANARGGDIAGDGGFVEVSGYKQLRMAGIVSVDAPAGSAGKLLLDPQILEITDTGRGTVLRESDPQLLEKLSALLSADQGYLDAGEGFIPNPDGAQLLNGTNSGGYSFISAVLIEFLLRRMDVIIYQHPGYRDDEDNSVPDLARILINAPITAPTGNHDLTIATAGQGEVIVQRNLDFTRSTGALKFFSFGGPVSVSAAPGVEIKGGRGSVLFDGVTDVGSRNAPLRIRVVADDGATKANFATCAIKGLCSDTGTKVDFQNVELPTFDDHFFVQIVSDKFRGVRRQLSLKGIADMLGESAFYRLMTRGRPNPPVIEIICYGGCTQEQLREAVRRARARAMAIVPQGLIDPMEVLERLVDVMDEAMDGWLASSRRTAGKAAQVLKAGGPVMFIADVGDPAYSRHRELANSQARAANNPDRSNQAIIRELIEVNEVRFPQ
jgi:filamentous hemagglutinin family protein